jgi:GNAT superfamily N-acetyltransferase
VYVAPDARGQGLGRRMVTGLSDRLRSRGVRRLLLATRDAHEVYAALGFGPLAHPEQWMELDTRSAD